MGVSFQSLVRRIPKMLGPVLGGTFIAIWGVADGVRYAFVAALGGAWLWAIHPHANLLVAFGFGICGTLWFAWKSRGSSG
jgi:hypothetical protein